jgi:hypothetical protein
MPSAGVHPYTALGDWLTHRCRCSSLSFRGAPSKLREGLGSPQLRKVVSRRRSDAHATVASCHVVQASERRGAASKGAGETSDLLGVSTRSQRTKVKSICNGGPAKRGEWCADALRSLHGVAPSSFPLAPSRGEGDKKRVGVMIGGRGQPSAGLVRSDWLLLFRATENQLTEIEALRSAPQERRFGCPKSPAIHFQDSARSQLSSAPCRRRPRAGPPRARGASR